MSQFDPEALALQMFVQLRPKFKLGVGEYLAALQAIKGGFGDRPEQLAQTLRLLWCHSVNEQTDFDGIWQALATQKPQEKVSQIETRVEEQTETILEQADLSQFAPNRQLTDRPQVTETDQQQIAPLPVRAPLALAEAENMPNLQTYYPLSRRSMVYNWRYLRRPVANGPKDVLDVPETVAQVVQRGYFLAPVYRNREQNEAKLLLLVDQNGSMMPLHRFTRDLVETALTESSLKADHVAVFYFQNVPRSSVFQDPYRTKPIPLDQVLAECDQETSVLIVSDAGAARGHLHFERIRATTEFLFQLRQSTGLIAWLNPIPAEHWAGSSAEILEKIIPMRQMDQDGFSQVIDIIRGQTLHHYQFPFL